MKDEKKSYKTVDATKVTFSTLESITEKYGLAFDRKAAIAAATLYCKACARTGGAMVEMGRYGGGDAFPLHQDRRRFGRSSRKRQSTHAKKRWNWTAIAFHKSMRTLETSRSLGRLCLPRHSALLLHCRHPPQQTTNAASKPSGKCSLNVQDSGRSSVKLKGPPPRDSKQNITASRHGLQEETDRSRFSCHELYSPHRHENRMAENKRCARSRSESHIRHHQRKRVCATCARVRHQGTFEPLVTDLTKEQARIMKMRKALQ